MAAAPLVTAVIPAHDAERTIDETLQSVRAQNYRNLEIIVVDDGSTDDTARIAEDHVAADPRVRLIRQINTGVAAARNRGIAEAKSEFIAPIDADDLWEPTKIEKQMAAMLRGGPKIGLVYTWQAVIDEESRIIATGHQPDLEGRVLAPLLRGNIVGGGSPALMRKQAILESGGYDTSLRANNAQGCEDLKLYIQISERYEFAVVREHLTGYRRTRGRMSANLLQMLRSYDLVASQLRQTSPQHVRQIEEGRVNYRRWLLFEAVRNGDVRGAATLFAKLFARSPSDALKTLARLPLIATRRVGNSLQRGLGRERAFGVVRFLPPPDTASSSAPDVRQ